ncbi:MAG: response regulator transcription factor [Gammaproteobacteria bacterium]|nr:response regulator transcription factor [Gammaproteobacteria bacterium]MBT4492382.1 response regulator transcription factor [Gammaproteobacteria bacterium]MBT7369382.1 response regulator transcription factor [Gammaproteobacteria bacterium]
MLGFMIFVALASGSDLIADLMHGVDTLHLVQEALILTLSLLVIAWIMYKLFLGHNEIVRLKAELETAKMLQSNSSEEGRDVRQRLSDYIRHQFEAWQLTPSEREIGMLLIKGLSFKEIAQLRGTTEKTIRQQASAIYRKAELPGRHAFAAWFIEEAL